MPENQSLEALEGRARHGRVMGWAAMFEMLLEVGRG